MHHIEKSAYVSFITVVKCCYSRAFHPASIAWLCKRGIHAVVFILKKMNTEFGIMCVQYSSSSPKEPNAKEDYRNRYYNRIPLTG